MSVPKLRFKEFDESWSQVILDDLAEVERGKFSVRPRNDPRYFGGKMPFVQTGDVTGSDVYLKGFSQTLNKDGIKVSKVFPEDTILITIAANIGDTTITQYPVACPDSVVAIQPKKELTNTIFLKNVIDLQKDFLDSQATQNAQKNINLQVLKPLELIVPSLKEQTKIASFLSAVDEKISQLTRKHELLSQYKQGMMQKLFSQQLRFKADDGREFGEWEEKCLSELFEYANGKSFEAEVVENGKFKLITLNSIDIKANLKKVHKTISNSDNSLIKNDLIMILSDVAHGNFLGLTAIIPDNSYVLNQRVGRLRSRSEINIVFIRFYINFNQKYFKLNGQGSSQLNLSKADILNFPVSLPCIEEQTKIANFLSAIDQKIEVVAQQIEQAKTWKKGLLQQMFV